MLPARNRKDLEDIPESVRKELQFVWLERVEDAVGPSRIDGPVPKAA